MANIDFTKLLNPSFEELKALYPTTGEDQIAMLKIVGGISKFMASDQTYCVRMQPNYQPSSDMKFSNTFVVIAPRPNIVNDDTPVTRWGRLYLQIRMTNVLQADNTYKKEPSISVEGFSYGDVESRVWDNYLQQYNTVVKEHKISQVAFDKMGAKRSTRYGATANRFWTSLAPFVANLHKIKQLLHKHCDKHIAANLKYLNDFERSVNKRSLDSDDVRDIKDMLNDVFGERLNDFKFDIKNDNDKTASTYWTLTLGKTDDKGYNVDAKHARLMSTRLRLLGERDNAYSNPSLGLSISKRDNGWSVSMSSLPRLQMFAPDFMNHAESVYGSLVEAVEKLVIPVMEYDIALYKTLKAVPFTA